MIKSEEIIINDEMSRNLKMAWLFQSELIRLCTPGMGVILWGESPLYVNPVNKSMIY